jgi:parallel beta-helix repeat protein
MKTEKLITTTFSIMFMALHVLAQGNLTPPGAPAATMKTLDQIEPRMPISQADMPLTISAPGSYYLTTNLTGTAANNGITISSDDVTLDLMGFTLRGVPSSLEGINVSSVIRNLTIRNGIVREWGRHGVDAFNAKNSSLEQLKAYNNGWESTFQDGLSIGLNGRVTACQAENNQRDGIVSRSGCTITDSTASFNGDDGIETDVGCTITDSTAYNNGDDGIVTDSGCTITDSSAYRNGDEGIETASGCTVNRCTTHANKNDGIQVSSDCAVVGNTCDGNSFLGDGAGILATSSDNRIEGNHATRNTRGIDINGIGNYIAANTVRDNGDNYDIVAGNQLNLLLGELPESIDWPASVKLAGTLTGESGSAGITINADDVTIDLDGHALIGVPGSLEGIAVPTTRYNITIRDGVVRNWGGHGVDAILAQNSSLENLKAYTNGWDGTPQDGLRIGNNGRIAACQAQANQNFGIRTGRGSTITDSTVNLNGSYGIFAGFDNTITHSSAERNGSGIVAGAGSMITDSTSGFNDDDGIGTSVSCTVNRCTVYNNTGNGIRVSSDSAVVGNTCDSNGARGGDSAGIFATGSDNRIDGNNVTDNDRGIDVDGSGNIIIRNTASGNTTANYDIAGSNKDAQILTPGSGFISTDPWANFSF